MRYTLIIGNKNYSSWSLRPWLVLKHLGLDFDEVVIPLLQDNFKEKILAHSHAGKVPILKADGFDLWDSLAICEFLNDQYPEGKLWPTDPKAKAVARSISCEMHSGFFNIRNDMPMNMRRVINGVTPTAACQSEIDRVVEIWTNCRAEFGQEGPYLFGSFTIADAMFAPVVNRFATYQVPVSGQAATYMKTMQDMPSMKEWKADAIEEEWVIEAVEL
ncbi:MAG: glutathione S-transferase family protein [Methylocystaceae bacterium]|nr:glutathione S-transferase family protein [Methylocystaceae bacterium]